MCTVIQIRRHELWERNKALVERQNKQKEKTFTLALNEASDWTAEEVFGIQNKPQEMFRHKTHG